MPGFGRVFLCRPDYPGHRTSSALFADAPAFPQIVAEPALQVGYGHGMREVGVHLHQSPVLSFVAEADGLELAVLQARHQEIGEGRAAAGARILSQPFDAWLFQADGELFLQLAQGAFGRCLQAFAAAAGKVPVAREGDVGFFVAFVDDQAVAIEQRQLGAAERRNVVHRGLRVAGWVNPA